MIFIFSEAGVTFRSSPWLYCERFLCFRVTAVVTYGAEKRLNTAGVKVSLHVWIRWKPLHSGWVEVWLRRISGNNGVVIVFVVPSLGLKIEHRENPAEKQTVNGLGGGEIEYIHHSSCFYSMTSISRTFFHHSSVPITCWWGATNSAYLAMPPHPLFPL